MRQPNGLPRWPHGRAPGLSPGAGETDPQAGRPSGTACQPTAWQRLAGRNSRQAVTTMIAVQERCLPAYLGLRHRLYSGAGPDARKVGGRVAAMLCLPPLRRSTGLDRHDRIGIHSTRLSFTWFKAHPLDIPGEPHTFEWIHGNHCFNEEFGDLIGSFRPEQVAVIADPLPGGEGWQELLAGLLRRSGPYRCHSPCAPDACSTAAADRHLCPGWRPPGHARATPDAT